MKAKKIFNKYYDQLTSEERNFYTSSDDGIDNFDFDDVQDYKDFVREYTRYDASGYKNDEWD